MRSQLSCSLHRSPNDSGGDTSKRVRLMPGPTPHIELRTARAHASSGRTGRAERSRGKCPTLDIEKPPPAVPVHAGLLALVPMYAAYSYLVVDDTICIVDPHTYAIVDMIRARSNRLSRRSRRKVRSLFPANRCDASMLACRRIARGRTFASALLSEQKFRAAWSCSTFSTHLSPVLQSLQTMRISSSRTKW